MLVVISQCEGVGLKYYTDSKTSIAYLNNINDIYENIEEYNPKKEQKILIVLDDMVADMLSNKNLRQIVTELFITGRKLNIFVVVST